MHLPPYSAANKHTSMKSAYITPRLKKADLEPTYAKSYRPISNLPVLSKLLERLVCEQLVTYLRDNGLLPERQLAYRRYHSTETVMPRVLSDILSAGNSDISRAVSCI